MNAIPFIRHPDAGASNSRCNNNPMKPSSLPRRLRSFFMPVAVGLSLVLGAQAAQFAITTNNTAKLSWSPAFDGTNYLVVVQGDGLFIRANTNRQVAVQFVSQSGALVGPLIDLGRNATPSANNTPLPHAAFDGTNYLVVWTDSVNFPNDDIFGQFISTAGALVGSPFPISQAPKDQSVHGVVFDGTNYFVHWVDHRRGVVAGDGLAPYDSYGQRVSTSGALVGGEIRISPGDDARDYENSRLATHENGRLVSGATNYFVVWTEGPLTGGNLNVQVRGQFVSPSGTLVGSPITIKPNDGIQISSPNLSGIGFDGTNYLVSWHQDVSPTQHDLLGQRVSRAGSLVGGVVTISTAPAMASLPFFAFDGVNYLVTWSDSFGTTNQTCKARFIDPAGNPVSSEFAPFSPQGTNAPLIAPSMFDGKRFLVGGLLGNFNNGDLYGTFISPLPRGAFPIAITGASEFALSSAFDGTNYLVAIQGGFVTNFPTGRFNLEAQMVSRTGALVGAKISLGLTDSEPFLAFDGTNYLLISERMEDTGSDGIYGQFIGRNGNPVGSSFAISRGTGIRNPDGVIFDGSNYLVFWSDRRNGDTNQDIYGQFVTPAGALLRSEIPITTDAESQRLPSAAFDGTNFFVVWQSKRSGTSDHDTQGRFVSRAGVLGTQLLISQSPSPRYNPTSIAFDGTNFLVVWNRDIGPGFPSPDDWDIYARLVTRAGTFVGNEFPITTAAGSQPFFGGAIFDGANYLVNWIDAPTGNVGSRFFNRLGIPLGSEFSLFGSQGTRFPIGGFFFGGGRLLATASYLDSNFKNGDVYGLFVPKTRLDFAGPVTSGQVPLRLTGMPGVPYSIQGTTNLLSAGTVWTTLATSNALSGTFNFTDTNAVGSTGRFYRAVLP